MSHAFNNTLLASLGFQDKDLGKTNHDAMTIEIATQPGVFLDAVLGAPDGKKVVRRTRVQCVLESAITKGGGQYKQTIGFLDALISWVEEGERAEEWEMRGKWVKEQRKYSDSRVLAVEVKSRITSAAELLRQLRLYDVYLEDMHYHKVPWVVISLYPDDTQYEALLKQQGYKLIVVPT